MIYSSRVVITILRVSVEVAWPKHFNMSNEPPLSVFDLLKSVIILKYSFFQGTSLKYFWSCEI